MRFAAWACLAIAMVPQAKASSAQVNFAGLALDIPDDNAVGTSDTRVLSFPFDHFQSLKVHLNIVGISPGGYNGDLFVTLTHGSGYSVLLNRVGRSEENLFGYSDDGLGPLVFSDTAILGDVHRYREALYESASTPLPSSLTGTWQPDARSADPDYVVATDPRTEYLASFAALDPSGAWTLFAADLSAGGEHRLESWGLEFISIPDSSPAIHGLVWLGCLAWSCRRRGDRR